MGTTTTNLGLYKPTVGETGWGALVDANFDTLDDVVYDSAHLIRYVDYVNGSDSNSGLSPGLAKKTIAAAYSNLKTSASANYTADSGSNLGVGTLVLLPGDHDVGTGFVIDWNRPVHVRGTRSGRREHAPENSASRIISSSSAATSFVKIDGGANNIARGIAFEDIAFRMDHTVNTALTSIIYAKRVGYLTVERCSFTNADGSTNVSVWAVLHDDATDSTGEAGWARIRDNMVSRLGLYKATCGASSGGNFNRGRISDNVVFYGGSLPMIHLDANVNGLLCDGNNLEGSATAIKIGPNGTFTQNTFIENSGEDPSSGTPPNPFYDLAGSISQCAIIGGICASLGASGYGVWVNFSANAYRNYVLGVFDLTDTTTAYKRKINETSHADKNLLIPFNAAMTTYTASNVSTDRSYDANATTVDELADVLGTLIADLRVRGWVK